MVDRVYEGEFIAIIVLMMDFAIFGAYVSMYWCNNTGETKLDLSNKLTLTFGKAHKGSSQV